MYTIGDFLIRIKNAYMANKKTMEFPYSKVVFSIAKILEKEGYIKKVSAKGGNQKSQPKAGSPLAKKVGSERKTIEIELKYENKIPAVSDIKLVSRPSIHYYIGKSQVRNAVPRHATGIISTNQGVMTSKQAQKEGVGGELICQIY